jgi:hypothetical protein
MVRMALANALLHSVSTRKGIWRGKSLASKNLGVAPQWCASMS